VIALLYRLLCLQQRVDSLLTLAVLYKLIKKVLDVVFYGMQGVGRKVLLHSNSSRNFSIFLAVLSDELPHLLVKIVEEPILLYAILDQRFYISVAYSLGE
jgi:hypothetical protein